MMLMEQQQGGKTLNVPAQNPEVFVACLHQELAVEAFKLTRAFREVGLRADMDHQGRSLKAQFKYADKLGARYVAILGDDEIAKGVVKLRNMNTKEETEIALADAPMALKDRERKLIEEA